MCFATASRKRVFGERRFPSRMFSSLRVLLIVITGILSDANELRWVELGGVDDVRRTSCLGAGFSWIVCAFRAFTASNNGERFFWTDAVSSGITLSSSDVPDDIARFSKREISSEKNTVV